MKPDKRINTILLLIKLFSVLVIIVIACVIGHFWGSITVDDIFNYVPNNYFLAALTIIVLFFIKSLSVVLPLMVLYISCGMIFSPFIGILINIVGLWICLSVPYYIGKFCGKDLLDRLLLRYNNIAKLKKLKIENEWFLSYILRMIGVLPGDIISMSLGAMDFSYKKYILGSIIGLLPRMIIATYLGVTITEPNSPAFILLCIVTVIFTLGSVIIHRKYLKKKMNEVIL